MKSPLRLSNRLSSFRFSLASLGPLRSPVSPMTPQSPPQTFHNQEPLPNYHFNSSTRSSTAQTITGPETIIEKSPGLAVTVVESSTDNHHTTTKPPQTPSPLPTPTNTTYTTTTINQHYYHQPTHSPITPWHATFHRNAATTDQETHYLTQTTHLRRARILIILTLFLLSTTTTALTSATLHHHHSTNLPTSFSLPLWPTNTNLTPTLLTLTTSVLALLLTLPTTILHLLRGPNPRTTLCNTLFTLLSTITTILTLSVLTATSIQSPSPPFSSFISKTLTALVITTGPKSTKGLSPNGVGASPRPETIQSFTCSLSNTAAAFARDAKTLSLPYPSDSSSMVPSGFDRICIESQVNLGLVIVMCIVSIIGVVVAGWSWGVERRIEGLRGEREVLASREGGTCGGDGVGKVMEMPEFVEEGDLKRRY